MVFMFSLFIKYSIKFISGLFKKNITTKAIRNGDAHMVNNKRDFFLCNMDLIPVKKTPTTNRSMVMSSYSRANLSFTSRAVSLRMIINIFLFLFKSILADAYKINTEFERFKFIAIKKIKKKLKFVE